MRLWAALLVLALWTAPAQAALNLCNRTSYVLYAATAAITPAGSEARGWARIVPGDCQAVRTEALTAPSYMVYARSGFGHSGPPRAWGGHFPVCVKDADFVLRQKAMQPLCGEDDAFALPFAALDTHDKRNWTMTFDETPAYPSLIAAQLAGVKRLLADNGFPVGSIDGKPDKATGAALAAFRGKMRFPPSAGNAELFDALEAQARKTVTPAGYTVCNDTRDMLLVALAQTGQDKAIVHGWWKIEGGACARAITTPLASDAVYLLAEKKSGDMVVSGNDKFCVTAVQFDIQGRGNCAARGFSEVGFAATGTHGRPGFVARIGDNGLKPSSQAGMLK